MEEKRCYGCMRVKTEEGPCPYCGYDGTVPNEEHQLPVGTMLNEQYLIGRVLGQGGFGITYMGWDKYLDIPVAIKEYFPNQLVSRNCKASTDVISGSGKTGVRYRNNKDRFMREAKMLARMSDVREIVHINTFFLANNTAYIVMEYVDGVTLGDYVKEHGGRLEAGETVRLFLPVMNALMKVHKAGLVHRDISPDNIMLPRDGGIRLVDFGAVRDVGEAAPGQPLTSSTEAILKQGFAPIEQYQSRGSLGPWTDVYAICATICYCLTGEVPADAPGRILGEEIVWPSEKGCLIPAKMEEVLKSGMAIQAKERIQSMDELYGKMKEFEYWEPGNEENAGSSDSGSAGNKKDSGAGMPGGIGRTAAAASAGGDTEENRTVTVSSAGGNGEGSRTAAAGGSGRGGNGGGDSGSSGGKWRQNPAVLAGIAAAAIVLIVIAFVFSRKPESGTEPETKTVKETETLPKQTEESGTPSLTGEEISGQQEEETREENTSEESETSSEQPGESETAENQMLLEGQCGDHVFYRLNKETKELVLYGESAGRWPTWNFRKPSGYVPQDKYDATLKEYPWSDYCRDIKKVIIEDNVRYIGRNTFFGFTKLKKIEGLENVESIGIEAFADCRSLKSLTLGGRLRSVSEYAFSGCEALQKVKIESSVVSVGIAAFQNCPVRNLIVEGDPSLEESDGGTIFFDQYNKDAFTESVPGMKIAAKEGTRVETLADRLGIAFESTGEAGRTARGVCGDHLTWRLNLDTGNLMITGDESSDMYNFVFPEGWLGDMEEPEDAVECPWREYLENIKEVSVGPNVRSIGKCAFMGMYNLKKVLGMDNVVTLGEYAFDSAAISEIRLPEGLKTIGFSALSCESLNRVNIPASVDTIENVAFWHAPLREFYVEGDMPVNEQYFFSDISPLSEEMCIYAKSGTGIEAFANRYGIKFVSTGDLETVTP